MGRDFKIFIVAILVILISTFAGMAYIHKLDVDKQIACYEAAKTNPNLECK